MSHAACRRVLTEASPCLRMQLYINRLRQLYAEGTMDSNSAANQELNDLVTMRVRNPCSCHALQDGSADSSPAWHCEYAVQIVCKAV